MSWLVTTLVTVAIIALSAFFVAVEFSLINARRHRLEDAAATSPSARAALRSSSELTLLLAGSQLGITVCTLALGAITKPAVHHALMGPLEATGLPEGGADVLAFVLALVIVTFLHLVVGEMAPKSWAIAHPERSAILLALPMRGFLWLTRPALRALNEAANALVRRTGVEPVDEVEEVQDAHGLRELVEHSAGVGTLEAAYGSSITNAIDMGRITMDELVLHRRRPTAVPVDATVADVQAATVEHGHLRVLLLDGDWVAGLVHVRDTLGEPADRPVRELAREAFAVPAQTPLHEAFTLMRETQTQLAVVHRDGAFAGVVTMSDILPRFFPRADGATRTT
ncbi:hemolysin family protein [Arsenicicoccus sp. oral taxon 190]|uniref:hemolysin family protein n=1 Tax=Arsenicicoccus sp. oral taxon 190 TaxID=1658671 RepID=UPI00067A0126|nr:hemolysin family protein [Arsenicicoccus sp. oral taxon 190]AKT51011.1 membrane protein [Arsenicicoccus sp. oral taxon 190]